jgi:putative ABC transport system permease protein
MLLWSLALRNLGRNARRTLLAGSVVALGFASFALAGGFMAQTFRGLRESTIRSGTGHLQFARPAVFSGVEDTTLEHGLAGADRVASILAADPTVEAVLPRIDFVGLVSNGARSIPFLGVGLLPLPERRHMDVASLVNSGTWLSGDSERGVVLGSGLATALNARVADTVTLLATTPDGTLNAQDATVVGLLDIGIKELNDRYLATSVGLASELLTVTGTVTKLVVVLREPAHEDLARTHLGEQLKRNGLDLVGRTWEELSPFYRQVRTLYTGIFGFMGLILAAVVLLATANTMIMAVAERTREVGTLRALGTRPGRIVRTFLAEGVALGLVGCAVGKALALIVTVALNHSGIMLPAPPGGTHGMPIHVAVNTLAYFAAGGAMLGVVVLASWLAARRAARIAIIEALAHV